MVPRSYLAYSASAHGAFVLGLLLLWRLGPAGPPQTYRIDFIGPTGGIANRVLESEPARRGARPASGRPSPLRSEDFGSRKPLPRPSILGAATEAPPQKPGSRAEPDRPGRASGGESAAGSEGPGLSMDMPNFPYPWYITQVRNLLWQRWSERMPEGGGETIVRFAILKSGNITDLRTASSSGDGAFDDVALGAVKDSAPFPPLPQGFGESFLNVHVRFTAE